MMEIPVRTFAGLQSFPASEGMPPDIKRAVKRALTALDKTKLEVEGTFFFGIEPEIWVEKIQVEQDAELSSWKYAVISLRVPGAEWFPEKRLELQNKIMDAVYSKLSPSQATKVSLDFSHV